MAVPPTPGLDDLYRAAPCGLLLAGPKGDVLHVNDTLAAWLGHEPAAMCAGMRFQDLLTTGGRSFHQTHLAPLLRMQGSAAEVKLELRCRDGTTLPAILNLTETTSAGQVLLHAAVLVARDRHRYEQELLRQRHRAEELAGQHAKDQEEIAAARAEALDRAKLAEQMMGIVSHDLRNPLSVVSMSAVLLTRMGLNDRQRPVVERVARSVQVAERLISDLLDFTQARVGGGLKVIRKPVDLHRVLADCTGQLGAAFPEHPVLHLSEGNGVCEADADRMAQAVGNLVANAVRYGSPGAPVVVRSRGGEGGVGVSVHNEGPAIPPQQRPTLFEPMVRGEHTGGARGVGLGLYIVREIALAHGGTIEVDSAEDRGTTFTIAWPLSG